MFTRRKRLLGYTKKSSYFAREILVLISKTRDACTVHKFGMQVVSQVVPARSHVETVERRWKEGRKRERRRVPLRLNDRSGPRVWTRHNAVRFGPGSRRVLVPYLGSSFHTTRTFLLWPLALSLSLSLFIFPLSSFLFLLFLRDGQTTHRQIQIHR